MKEHGKLTISDPGKLNQKAIIAHIVVRILLDYKVVISSEIVILRYILFCSIFNCVRGRTGDQERPSCKAIILF